MARTKAMAMKEAISAARATLKAKTMKRQQSQTPMKAMAMKLQQRQPPMKVMKVMQLQKVMKAFAAAKRVDIPARVAPKTAMKAMKTNGNQKIKAVQESKWWWVDVRGAREVLIEYVDELPKVWKLAT